MTHAANRRRAASRPAMRFLAESLRVASYVGTAFALSRNAWPQLVTYAATARREAGGALENGWGYK